MLFGDDVEMDASKGTRTRRRILERAAELASVSGLEGLSIGELAHVLGMSKSGLYAHFESKEDLQLTVVDLARERFENDVIHVADEAPDGLSKAKVLIEAWTEHIENTVYPGGCFFAAAAAEFDDRPGPVRDRIAKLSLAWIERLRAQFEIASSLGEIRSDAEPEQLAFEIHAFVQEANWARQLLRDPKAFSRARRSIDCRLVRATMRECRPDAGSVEMD